MLERPAIKTTPRVLCLALALMWSPLGRSPARAQAPIDVARQVFGALDSANWTQVVALTHPMALTWFHDEQVMLARTEEEARTDPSVPEEFRDHKPSYELIFSVQSADQLDAMPASVMLAHYLGRMRHGAFTVVGVKSVGGAAIPLKASRRIVGTVMDGDSVAYVVFVETIGVGARVDSTWKGPTQHEQLLTLRRDGAAWKIMLGPNILYGGGITAFSLDDTAK